MFSRLPTQLPGQKWNKVKVIFIKWQNFLNVASPDSRSLSILTHKLSTKGSPTICVHQFLVKIRPRSPPYQVFLNFWWAHSPQLTSTSHNRKNKKSSDFMYNTQITIENTTICFSFSLTELDLYWSKVFVEGTWKCTGIQTIIACNYLNLISF